MGDVQRDEDGGMSEPCKRRNKHKRGQVAYRIDSRTESSGRHAQSGSALQQMAIRTAVVGILARADTRNTVRQFYATIDTLLLCGLKLQILSPKLHVQITIFTVSGYKWMLIP